MLSLYNRQMIADNISMVNERIKKAAQACGRNPEDIRLVCVTKGRSIEEIEEVVKCGVSDIGENKVQEAKEKYRSFALDTFVSRAQDDTGNRAQDDRVRWHMVGHLQTNKAREAVKMFDLIHSLDLLKLAKEINKEAEKINKVQDVLIEVNTSGEAAKFGVAPDGLMGLVKDVISLKNIRLLGLMTIAPVVKAQEEARPYFRKLRGLKDEVTGFLSSIQYPVSSILSMGMSQDYEVAIEEGATMVRIGTAIFEDAD